MAEVHATTLAIHTTASAIQDILEKTVQVEDTIVWMLEIHLL